MLFSYLSFLLVAEYEVYPLMDSPTHIFWLQLALMLGDEIVGVFGPNRKMHIVHSLFLLSHSEVVLLQVH